MITCEICNRIRGCNIYCPSCDNGTDEICYGCCPECRQPEYDCDCEPECFPWSTCQYTCQEGCMFRTNQ